MAAARTGREESGVEEVRPPKDDEEGKEDEVPEQEGKEANKEEQEIEEAEEGTVDEAGGC